MRLRMRPLLIAMVALAMLLVASPAGAGKPEKPGKPDDPAPIPDCTSVTEFVGIKGGVDFECEWTPADLDPRSMVGTVTVDVLAGELSALAVFVRDSSPGDICLLEQEWLDASGEPMLPLRAAAVAASFPLVEGDLSYWDVGEHWCAQYDPIDGIRDDLNGDPLHLFVSMRAKRGTSVTVSLTP